MPSTLPSAARRSATTTFRLFWRAARQVFHEALGAMFGLFAVYGLIVAWRQWQSRPVWWLLSFALAYAAMMAAFAFLSFRRARRVR